MTRERDLEKRTPFWQTLAQSHEPILHDGQVIVAYVPKYDLPLSATTKAGAKPLGRVIGILESFAGL